MLTPFNGNTKTMDMTHKPIRPRETATRDAVALLSEQYLEKLKHAPQNKRNTQFKAPKCADFVLIIFPQIWHCSELRDGVGVRVRQASYPVEDFALELYCYSIVQPGVRMILHSIHDRQVAHGIT